MFHEATAAEPAQLKLPVGNSVEDWQTWAESQERPVETSVIALHHCKPEDRVRYALATITRVAILSAPDKPELNRVWNRIMGEPLTQESLEAISPEDIDRIAGTIRNAFPHEHEEWLTDEKAKVIWRGLTQTQLTAVRTYVGTPDELVQHLNAQADAALDFGCLTSDFLWASRFLSFACELMADCVRFAPKEFATGRLLDILGTAIHRYEGLVAKNANENRPNLNADHALLGRRRLAFNLGQVAAVCLACERADDFHKISSVGIGPLFHGNLTAEGYFPIAAEEFELLASKRAAERAAKRPNLRLVSDRFNLGTRISRSSGSGNALEEFTSREIIEKVKQERSERERELLEDVISPEDLDRRVNLRLSN
ncbi:MAG: hypothetical protein R3C18_17725 [Planctomycetaceae bacterium]